MTTTDLQAKIREAYDTLAAKPQAWVSLRTLRPLVGGERADVDCALIALLRTGTCHLVPESNRKALTDAHREAAIRVGTEDKHHIAFDDDYDY